MAVLSIENLLGAFKSDPLRWAWTALAGGSVLGTLFMFLDRARRRARGRIQSPPNMDLKSQAVKVGVSEEGTEVYGSPLTKGKIWMGSKDETTQTLYDNFLLGKRLSNDGDCLGSRRPDGYVWQSYGEVLEQAQSLGAGIINLGIEPGSNTFISIYSQNRPDWYISYLAAMSQSLVVVPLYDTLGKEAASFIISQTGTHIVLCDSEEKARNLIKSVSDTPSLKFVAVMGENQPSQELFEEGAAVGIRVLSFNGLIQDGRANPRSLNLPTSTDLCIVCYTSGTTGTPKGVQITHQNIISNGAAANLVLNEYGIYFAPGETVISYLPLAHMFEQMVHMMTIQCGGRVGYFSGKIQELPGDIKALKPAFFPVVPRLLNRLYDKIKLGLEQASPVARFIFNVAYQSKLRELKRGIVRRDTIWDGIVFRKLQNELGGKIRFMVTGSAPIAPEVLEMCRVALGAVILEGYGQTETTAVATMTLPNENAGGHVGGPAPCCHVTLKDVPELQYFSRDRKGEVCVKGSSITPGYFKDPEKTAELLDTDGWLHSGDIGMWLPNGTLKIIDRKKHIFKLAQGEYVAPEKIESIYNRASCVEQVFVDGRSIETKLVGIVVPNQSELEFWHKEHKDGPLPSFEELCNSPDLKAHVLQEMQRIGKENGLNSIEQVKDITLITEPFSPENGLLTPTLKSKRPQLRQRFDKEITTMYGK